jgi:Cu-Zn family superoxide dismutase
MRAALRSLVAAAATAAACAAQAQTLQVQMHRVDANGVGASIGIVTVTKAAGGVMFTPALQGLPPGLHGFHVHEKPSCEPAMDPAPTWTPASRAGTKGQWVTVIWAICRL